MPEEQITYYALVMTGRTRENPSGLARRRTLPDGGIVDETFRRDLRWHDADVIEEWEHGESSEDSVEITEAEAERIMEQFRQLFGGAE